jgi:Na+/H+-dicarboxylate symporter
MEEQNEKKTRRAEWILTWFILGGLVVGVVLGQVLYWAYNGEVPPAMLDAFSFVGNTFFLGLLTMVLVPLVASSVIIGVVSIGDPRSLGKVGGFTLLYYFATMAIAVVMGLVIVVSIQPGDPNGDGTGLGAEIIEKGEAAYQGEDASKREAIEQRGQQGLWGAFKNIVNQMLPSNPIKAAAEGQLLPVIAFSLIVGVVLAVMGPAGRPLVDVFDALFKAMMMLVSWILWLAPIGVLALVAWAVANIGLQNLAGPMFWYVVAVLLGLAIHMFIVLPLVLWFFGKANPFAYMHQMRAALMTALGTSSSSATLPVSIESAEQFGGVSKRSAQFVLPLGATVNMDGTALYEAVAVVFLFQAYGIPLGPIELVIIVITATLAAIGAAGIPSAGLVTMVIVVNAVNDSIGGDKRLPLAAVGIILGIDRILDMCRTMVNVWGDCVGAKIITRIAPDET